MSKIQNKMANGHIIKILTIVRFWFKKKGKIWQYNALLEAAAPI